MSSTDKTQDNHEGAVDKIKDAADTVGISVAVVASETWDKTRDLAGTVGHKLSQLVDDAKDKLSGADDDDEQNSARPGS
ncbi:MAG: hypothetical protein ABIR83_14225 [Nakamurella sp.]